MIGRRDTATWIDLQVAGARWLAYLVAAIGFVFLWLIEPQRVPFSLAYLPVPLLIVGAIAYNLVVTGMAFMGWLPGVLMIGTVVVDTLLAGAAYLVMHAGSDAISLVVDPLFLVMLLPVVAAAVRLHWLAGMLAALFVGSVRAGVLLSNLPKPLAPVEVLSVAFGVLFLLGIGFLSGFLAEYALRVGVKRDVGSAREQLRALEAALEREVALQQVTSALGDTLSFERAMASALDVVDRAMIDWGARGGLVGAVFLFEGSSLRLTAARGLPRYELNQRIAGKAGVVAQALDEAELAVTTAPHSDPELCSLTALADCRVVAAIPLRIGFESFGAMVIGTSALQVLAQAQLDFLSAVAERATVVLHNAMLYQNLQGEKDRIMRIEEDARRKLSRDLHDGPTQSISAIAMRVNFARKVMVHEPDKMAAELESIENLARQTVQEIRQMLFTMRPLVLETQGLVPALRTLAEKFGETDDLKVVVNEVEEAASRLDGRQAAGIFYIIEEALGNARKYSQANLVTVRLWVDAGLFVAQIKDDGVGFDAAAVLSEYEGRGSLGMVNMRERAELINGSLDIKSTPGHGTTVTLVTPLIKPAEP